MFFFWKIDGSSWTTNSFFIQFCSNLIGLQNDLSKMWIKQNRVWGAKIKKKGSRTWIQCWIKSFVLNVPTTQLQFQTQWPLYMQKHKSNMLFLEKADNSIISSSRAFSIGLTLSVWSYLLMGLSPDCVNVWAEGPVAVYHTHV